MDNKKSQKDKGISDHTCDTREKSIARSPEEVAVAVSVILTCSSLDLASSFLSVAVILIRSILDALVISVNNSSCIFRITSSVTAFDARAPASAAASTEPSSGNEIKQQNVFLTENVFKAQYSIVSYLLGRVC